MTEEEFQPFDAADYVRTVDEAVIMVETALEDSGEDPTALPAALGIIARSGNMSELARRVGMSRDGLYTALSAEGNPTWATVLKVTKALNLHLDVRSDRTPA